MVTSNANSSRTYKVLRKSFETKNVVSIYLSSEDGSPLGSYDAGQHLDVLIPNVGWRSYVISSFSQQPRAYRITVERLRCNQPQGTCSSAYWHDDVVAGHLVKATGPLGAFCLPRILSRPIVIASSRIGIAAAVAMAEELAIRSPRHPVFFFHEAASESEFRFESKVLSLRVELKNAHWGACCINPRRADRDDAGCEASDMIDLMNHKGVWELSACDFYVCGPDEFVHRTAKALRRVGVPMERVNSEYFGREGVPEIVPEVEQPYMPLSPRNVTFLKAGHTVVWTPESGSLLDLAHFHGIKAKYSCRTGMCGTCSQKIISGHVVRIREMHAKPLAGHELLCSNVPGSDITIEL